MAVTANDRATRLSRPPRAVAWVVLLASAAAVLVAGFVTTVIIFTRLGATPAPGLSFWIGFVLASVFTVVSISLRSLRWIYLLRRADARIPIRDAYIGYLSGLSLLFTPLFVGESAVRAFIQRARGRVPVATTLVVNGWERLLDLSALTVIGVGAAAYLRVNVPMFGWLLLAGVVLSLVTPIRQTALGALCLLAQTIARPFDPLPIMRTDRLAGLRTWCVALVTSVAAWLLPCAGLWLIAQSSGRHVALVEAAQLYASSSIASMSTLLPGGVLVTGGQMLSEFAARDFGEAERALIVLGVRLSTVGVSVALGVLFIALHYRSTMNDSVTHFDDIADAYDVQIPESRRHALLVRKTALMHAAVASMGVGRRGLDVGCGQGAYVARMRELGLDVSGIDMSSGQIRLAARNLGGDALVQVGSVLDIPAADATYDFVYVINVLHHLNSVEEQQRAFRELARVLRPGGLIFVHEINTRNPLFRFYMGYVFPSLNCIDEGIERWLLAHELHRYTDAQPVSVEYFTFLPDFVPASIVRLLAPIEQWLERSSFRVFSAHYMAVLKK